MTTSEPFGAAVRWLLVVVATLGLLGSGQLAAAASVSVGDRHGTSSTPDHDLGLKTDWRLFETFAGAGPVTSEPPLRGKPHINDTSSNGVAPRSIPGISDDVLQQADDVIRRVDGGLEPPTGVHPNGRQFRNDGRGGGQVLPELTTDGTSIRYNEWDVNPPGPGGRDAVRVVTGSDGSAWFTGDHYTTFTQIRPGS